VLAKLSAERFLPPHHLEATTASEAYCFCDIVSQSDIKHLEVSYLLKAARGAGHLENLRAGHMYARKIDGFVDYMLGKMHERLRSGGDSDKALTAACRWLALYNIARKVLRIRSGTTICSNFEADSEKADLQGAQFLCHFVGIYRNYFSPNLLSLRLSWVYEFRV
jgi:hypothetical protein